MDHSGAPCTGGVTTAVKAGAAYFALVFGAGFALGAIRVPFLVPRLGERLAELIETPFMFVAIVMAARFVGRRFALPQRMSVRLGVGAMALALMLAAETGLVVILQRRSVGEYLADRDPVAGTVYLAMLALFGLMPLILGRRGPVGPRD